MSSLNSFYQNRILLRDAGQSEFTTSRWRSKDLDPVTKDLKKWEWYHVGGFWIAEGFSAAQVQTASAAVAVGLNPVCGLHCQRLVPWLMARRSVSRCWPTPLETSSLQCHVVQAASLAPDIRSISLSFQERLFIVSS